MKSFILLLLIFSQITPAQTQGQGSNQQQLDEYEKEVLRFRKARRKILEKMLKDMDSSMDDMLGDDFGSMDAFKLMDKFFNRHRDSDNLQYGVGSSGVEYRWSEKRDEKVLTIVLKDKKTPVDLDITDDLITVKGKVISKSEFGTSMSSFSNSFSTPPEVDAGKVKIENDKEGNIVVRFPYKKGVIPPKQIKPTKKVQERKQIKSPIPGEVSI